MTFYLSCSCSPLTRTTAEPVPVDPACPVHGAQPQEIAALRSALSSARRDLAEARDALRGRVAALAGGWARSGDEHAAEAERAKNRWHYTTEDREVLRSRLLLDHAAALRAALGGEG